MVTDDCACASPVAAIKVAILMIFNFTMSPRLTFSLANWAMPQYRGKPPFYCRKLSQECPSFPPHVRGVGAVKRRYACAQGMKVACLECISGACPQSYTGP